MNRGHEAADDTEFVIENFRDGSEAVRCAGSVGDDVLTGIGLVVHAVNEHRGAVLGRSGHDDFLCACLDVHTCLGIFEEETGGLDDDISLDFVPLELCGVFFRCEADLLAIDDHVVALDFDVVVEDAVNGVILQHVGEIVRIEKVVDSDDFDVFAEILDCCAEDHASDSSETIDTDFDCHCVNPSIMLLGVYILKNPLFHNSIE